MIKAKDVSRYQGAWKDTGEPIVMIKRSGGDNGLYVDSESYANYEAARKANKAIGRYHFGGGVQSGSAEAAYFLKSLGGLNEGDVLALDVEAHLASLPNVVQWVSDFMIYVHEKTQVNALVYMNLATLNAHDWSGILKNHGLWLADWAVAPTAKIPTHYTYVMQQYSDGPNYDHDEWFGTLEAFKAYGYHASKTSVPPKPAPAPTPVKPTVEPVPAQPVPTASATVLPGLTNNVPTPLVIGGSPAPEPKPAPSVSSPSPIQVFVNGLVKWLKSLVGLK